MKQSRWLPPGTSLGKVRLAALVFGVFMVVMELLQLNPDPHTGFLALSLACGVLIVAVLGVTYARDSLVIPWDGPALAVCVVLLGLGGKDPLSVIGVAIGTVMTLSLYGNWASGLVRVVSLVPVMPLVAEFSEAPVARRIDWDDVQVWSLVPIVVLFWGLMRALKLALEREGESTAREHYLATISGRLLACTTPRDVAEILTRSTDDLCDLVPGLSVVVVRWDAGNPLDDAELLGLHGFPAVIGRTVPPFLPGRLFAPLAGGPIDFTVIENGTGGMKALGFPNRQWFALEVSDDAGVVPDPGARLTKVDLVLFGVPIGFGARLLGIPGRARVELIETVRAVDTQRRSAQKTTWMTAELAHRADHDDLTGLASRSAFFARLDSALAAADTTGEEVALMVIDLDEFKQINSSRGHRAGDALLAELGRRVIDAIGERGLAARLGGDEFAVVLPRVTGPDEARALADRVRRKLLSPVELRDGAVVVGATIGVAVTQDGLTGDDLLRCADMALHTAKEAGKARIEVYRPQRDDELARIRMLEEQLPDALAGGRIVVHYQPIVDPRTGHPAGLEALARWQHPTLGVLEANQFVELADRTGRGGALGAHVVEVALTQMRDWITRPGLERLWLSVNVSARQVSDPGFHDAVRRALDVTGVPPERLVLEIPEAAILAGPELRERLSALAAAGARISLDDFGAEFASLAHLAGIPVRQLKLDRTQLQALDPLRATNMARTIVSVSRFLDLETVAEAVETEEHARWAARLGIELAEGYLYAPPMAPELVSRWLAARDRVAEPRVVDGAPVDGASQRV